MAREGVTAALSFIEAKLVATSKNAKGVEGELRNALSSHKSKLAAMNSSCSKKQADVKKMRARVIEEAHAKCVEVFLAHCRNMTFAQAIAAVRGDRGEINLDGLRQVIEGADNAPSKTTVALGLAQYEAGFSELDVVVLVKRHMKVVREIALTACLQIGNQGKVVRKLSPGEIVEMLTPVVIGANGLERVNVRSLDDQAEGFVTVKGNQGTPFLEVCPKPYFISVEASQFAVELAEVSGCGDESAFGVGEVFELLEGPKAAPDTKFKRLRGKTSSGETGWVTLEDPAGKALLEKEDFWLVTQPVSITPNMSISDGTPMRKLLVKEKLVALGEEEVDAVRGLTRLHVKCAKDDLEGWVTVKGNKGSAFASRNATKYTCKSDVHVERRFAAGSDELKVLTVGDWFEVEEGPTVYNKVGARRSRCRRLSNNAEGWLSMAKKGPLPWTPAYTCVKSTKLQDAADPAAGESVRSLGQGEHLRVLALPEQVSGVQRVKVVALKDGAAGFATVAGEKGEVFLVARQR